MRASAALVVLLLTANAAPATSRHACRAACTTQLAVCAATTTRARCRRTVFRQCRKHGTIVCASRTTTTSTATTSTSTSTSTATTSTTMPYGGDPPPLGTLSGWWDFVGERIAPDANALPSCDGQPDALTGRFWVRIDFDDASTTVHGAASNGDTIDVTIGYDYAFGFPIYPTGPDAWAYAALGGPSPPDFDTGVSSPAYFQHYEWRATADNPGETGTPADCCTSWAGMMTLETRSTTTSTMLPPCAR
jgi:hypothetical protein